MEKEEEDGEEEEDEEEEEDRKLYLPSRTSSYDYWGWFPHKSLKAQMEVKGVPLSIL